MVCWTCRGEYQHEGRNEVKIDILTLFPNMFTPVMEESILGRANEKGILNVQTINIRDYSLDKHKKADDYPFGGGAGMVMTAEPIFRALEAIQAKGEKIIYMSPRGKLLNKEIIEDLAQINRLVLLCGHYEGVDERVIEHWDMEEISVGDYILTGGELPAMILIDAVARMVPQVLGSSSAHKEESVYSGLLEYPQFTKPRQFRGMNVPEVLVSGNHKRIHLWQFEKSLQLTRDRRPDLFEQFLNRKDTLTKEEKKIL
jgi:tRNA (guanine37-N1)-methyltransferase